VRGCASPPGIPSPADTPPAAGLDYGTYPGATSVLRGAITGRLAGIDAATRGG